MRKFATKSSLVPTRAAAPVVAGSRLPVWLMVGWLVLVTITLYWPAMRYGFANLDDPEFVTDNPHLQGGLTWAGVKWAFGNTEQAAYWAPLMWLSHLLAWQLFGLNAWGHHLINVLLHAANTALVFLVFRRMTGATWRSLMLAALFGWHPLRVESVVWITERKDVLSTFFWMLTLWAYARYVEQAEGQRPKAKVFFGLALMFFALGLMSKAMLVTMPFVLLLLDYWPLRRVTGGKWPVADVRRLVVEKIPFFVLAAVASAITFIVQQHGGAVLTMASLPLGARVGNALISYCRYPGKLFWPTDLAVFYPHPGYWPLGLVLLAGVWLCGISALFFVTRRRHPFLLIGWLWLIGTLLPVIQLVQSGEQAMADRFTYVPSLGLFILVIWGAHELTRTWRHQILVLAVAGSAVAVLCLALTRQQLAYWKDDETLFRHTLEVTENNYIAHLNLGFVLFNQGRTDEARRQFQEAIRLKPNNPDVHINLGVALLSQGQTDGAMGEFQEAIRLKPADPDGHIQLGLALFKTGQTDAAGRQFQEVIRLKPDFVEAHFNLGVVFGMQGRTGEAISEFQEALRLKPDDANVQSNLAKALKLKSESSVRMSGPAKP